MKGPINRRSFMKIAGRSIGIGTLYRVAPLLGAVPAATEINRVLGKQNGEPIKPFTFIQLSDTHVGFNGPPDPLGTKAFERAVEIINQLPQKPDLAIFTGDLTHDSEDKDVHAQRMKLFKEISSHMNVDKRVHVPGEHDAGLDGGSLFREHFGETNYSFDHGGIHFVALDNVSRAKPEVGPEQLTWLKRDLSRFPRAAPIVVFTHRPLFDLKPEWEWFTSDGDLVMNILAPYENVTVLYGHIHREHEHNEGHAKHFAARSLIFAFPDPEQTKSEDKKPLPFDKDQPFKNLGVRLLDAKLQGSKPHLQLDVHDIELTLREYSGTNGIQQLLKGSDA